MKKGISIHIGLNYVDPDRYDGWDGELVACEYDAKDMAALAKARGFKPSMLLGAKATAKAVTTAIRKAAESLKSGDTLFVSYSGHGGQVEDLNSDEGRYGDARDRKDETWCLFDRELVDDELAALWAGFKKGVRILVLADCCHSGSTTREVPKKPKGRVRLMPPSTAARVYEKHKALYDAIQSSLTGSEEEQIKATVLLISGCMDNQLSSDGDFNGLFTETLKEVWDNGSFSGGYRSFRNKIVSRMPAEQTPNYFVIGAPNPVFEKEIPFTIDASKNRRPPTKRATPRAKPIDIVLQALDETGYTDPRDGGSSRPDSKIKTWFRRLDQEDDKLGVPPPQRTSQFVIKVQGRLGIPVTEQDLINGDYHTPQEIADLV